MIKLFISQPMNGKSKDDILKERNSIFEYAKTMNDDVVLLESYFDDFEESTHPLKYLARSISVMADADLVYFCNGWKDTRGC